MSSLNQIVYLQKIGKIDQKILLTLKNDLTVSFKEYNLPVKILPDKMPLKDSEYNQKRGQYNASVILKKILTFIVQKNYFRTLGVMDVDIFTTDLNFVFGIATSPLKQLLKFYGAAVISVTRLREELYGKPKNKELFRLRTLKEAIHELGHTFSLEHCNNFCIMRFSNSLIDTDEKPTEFCESCSRKLKKFFIRINT